MKFSTFLKSFTICGLITISSCSTTDKNTNSSSDLVQYVDPYIGTGDHGHVFMGANVPFGLVQLGPTNLSSGWDWCSGYHYSDSTILGFGHMHLSGTGIGDLGDISLMPVIGDVKLTKGTLPDESTGLYSYFSHDKEKAQAGYYSVHLDRFGIDVELTATKRVGFHKYTFPQTDDARIIIDLERGIGWDCPTKGFLQHENDSVVSGYRYSRGWAKDQRIYFIAVFSKPIKEFSVLDTVRISDTRNEEMRSVFGQVYLSDVKAEEPIYVKVALSPVSIDNAKLNLQAELPSWDFDKTVKNASDAWNEELNKIVIETEDIHVKRTFYTALYHTMIAPSEFCDVNGDYYGADQKYHTNDGFTNYTTFSLWDTYRAAHPLMTLIHPEKMSDIINTMLTIYKQQGKLPVWHLVGNETDCMVGNPGIPVVADAILKGYDGFDQELAYEAMKNSAMLNDRGMNWLKEYGYIPYDKEISYETVAKGLEYALADWSLAQVAKKLEKKEDYEYFYKRSLSYKYYFDPKTKFMRGLSSNGKFREPFNPVKSSHQGDDYTEGNAWQYTWLVPHDIPGLINLMGGRDTFIQKLDSLFIVQGDLGEEASPDISGLIGQYAHGNEPSHHILYMYPYVNQPWKTAEKVRQVMSELYHDQPAGLSGNEDVGQMSAWYILSALGFYQVEPAGGKYIFGSPIVDEAVIRIKDGKSFKIVVNDNSPENRYIQHITLNSKSFNNYYINFSDIMNGGILEMTMGPSPSKTWGLNNIE
ncbi:putative alpha-1,2-mannosidase [Dysgonomonas hofstadii]|uniref:Putative alpha-1,2-mannosidase n=1 Tax=Dysgonomonas hofstadii TaxID=637886 RepID=A0A840CTZ3_9BACT|nr:GH92 family glycosyl hydrolase [Dysgonomonas hofstadii]MBB4038149.1 putative alpha-1,2-mannosidase [Dysgonomonas hofstadii]